MEFGVLALEWLSGGSSNAIASAVLNPMDVAKTRMQTMSSSASGPHASQIHLSEVLRSIYRREGIVGVWRPGLSASMAREMLYSGPRAGFYVPIRNHIKSLLGETDYEDHLMVKVLSALATGTLGAVIANPVDVVKIRMMVDPHSYKSMLHGVREISRVEGFGGLYKGLFPSTLRGAFIAVGELATYDHSKVVLKSQFSFDEGFLLHAASSLITGLVATTVAAPFDLLKSRSMNDRSSTPSSGTPTHKQGLVAMTRQIIREEGLVVLFRGWLPAYLRLGPHAMICFPLFEQIRRLLNLEYI
eukprot:gene3298-2432_t